MTRRSPDEPLTPLGHLSRNAAFVPAAWQPAPLLRKEAAGGPGDVDWGAGYEKGYADAINVREPQWTESTGEAMVDGYLAGYDAGISQEPGSWSTASRKQAAVYNSAVANDLSLALQGASGLGSFDGMTCPACGSHETEASGSPFIADPATGFDVSALRPGVWSFSLWCETCGVDTTIPFPADILTWAGVTAAKTSVALPPAGQRVRIDWPDDMDDMVPAHSQTGWFTGKDFGDGPEFAPDEDNPHAGTSPDDVASSYPVDLEHATITPIDEAGQGSLFASLHEADAKFKPTQRGWYVMDGNASWKPWEWGMTPKAAIAGPFPSQQDARTKAESLGGTSSTNAWNTVGGKYAILFFDGMNFYQDIPSGAFMSAKTARRYLVSVGGDSWYQNGAGPNDVAYSLPDFTVVDLLPVGSNRWQGTVKDPSGVPETLTIVDQGASTSDEQDKPEWEPGYSGPDSKSRDDFYDDYYREPAGLDPYED